MWEVGFPLNSGFLDDTSAGLIACGLFAGNIVLSHQLRSFEARVIDRGKQLREMKPQLETDLLYGAKAIAEALGCRRRRIYHLAEHGRMPIWNEPGIGLVARKSSLEAYFKKREGQALEDESN